MGSKMGAVGIITTSITSVEVGEMDGMNPTDKQVRQFYLSTAWKRARLSDGRHRKLSAPGRDIWIWGRKLFNQTNLGG